MKNLKSLLLSAFLGSISVASLNAQTWIGASNNNQFGTSTNWSSTPANNGTDNLVFGSSANNFSPSVNTNFSVNSLSFTSPASPTRYILNGSSTLSIGAGGITVNAGGSNEVDFNSSLPVTLSASQLWTTGGNLVMSSPLTGSSSILLTKSGNGSLTLANNNSSTFAGNITISGGTLYLGQDGSAGTGTITMQSGGTLAGSGSPTVANPISLNSGAILGTSTSGEMELSGTVTLQSNSPTVTLGGSETHFNGTLTGPANTALTFQGTGTGIALLKGTVTNVDSVKADNAAVVFLGSSQLPALASNAIQAINGGYVGIADATAATGFLGKINPSGFNGTIAFESPENATTPNVYSNAIDLSGFTSGNVRIGTGSAAILTGTITPAIPTTNTAPSFDFGGYSSAGGALVVQSVLADHPNAVTSPSTTATNVSVVSPSTSGGPAQNGLGIILQGANTFTGSISVAYSGVVLDSAGAAGAGAGNFSLGNDAYIGYTEATGYANFADFKSHLTSSTSTSILGVDSHTTIANLLAGGSAGSPRTVGDDINLGGFSSIYLGTASGATLTGNLTAPTDHTLRLVNLSDKFGDLTLTQNLTAGNVDAVVAGMSGSKGAIILTGTASTYAGGTTLAGGSLLVSNGGALGTGAIAVGATSGSSFSDNMALGASSAGVTIANNISVTDFLNIGKGSVDGNDNTVFHVDTNGLTLNGVISDVDASHHGRVYFTAPTTVTGANSYSGGTYVEANTTVTNNTGLGTSFVDIGYGAVLTFDTAHPSIANLSNAGQFLGIPSSSPSYTGTVKLSSNVVDVTISSGTFSGQITGTSGTSAAALIKNTGNTLTLLGNNSGQFTGGTTINGGVVAIGDSNTTGATFSGAVALNGGTLSFRPAGGETYNYSGSITGSSGSVSIGTGQAAGTLNVTAGSSTFSGNTFVNSGTLQIGADNVWSSASSTSISNNTKLQVNGSQTFLNLTGGGNVDIASTKTLTVNTTNGSTLSGTITGSGGLTKTGNNSLTLNGASPNSYSGPTTINAGTLFVIQSLTQSAVTVANGGTLGGSNTLGKLTTVQSGGHIAPGASGSIGTITFGSGVGTGLTLQTGSILDFQLNTTGASDKIKLFAGSTLTGSGGLADITLNLTNGGSFGGAGTYTLFDFTSAATVSFAANEFNLVNTIGGYTFSAPAINGSLLQVTATATAIPEPTTVAALLGVMGLGTALICRRARRLAGSA